MGVIDVEDAVVIAGTGPSCEMTRERKMWVNWS